MKTPTTQELIDGVRKALKEELDGSLCPNPRNVRYLSTSLLRLETILKMEMDKGRTNITFFGDVM